MNGFGKAPKMGFRITCLELKTLTQRRSSSFLPSHVPTQFFSSGMISVSRVLDIVVLRNQSHGRYHDLTAMQVVALTPAVDGTPLSRAQFSRRTLESTFGLSETRQWL